MAKRIRSGGGTEDAADGGSDAGPPDAPWAERELLVLREIMRLVGRSFEPARTIREALHLLSELLGLNRGRVVLLDPLDGLLKIRHAYGLTRAEVERGVYSPQEGITGQAYRRGMTVIVQDIDAEPAFLARAVPRSGLPQETVAFLALPLFVEGTIAGVLAAHRLRRRDRALADDMRILDIVARLVSQIITINRAVERRTEALEQENVALKRALGRSLGNYGIVGESAVLLDALRRIEQVSQTDATVLLLGESGTGKELFARALHLASPRRDAPFVRINCGAIPEMLFESELFGHEKGAFTGAVTARAGRFEQAAGGTVFLDEIGDLPLPMQVKLLRVLQERVVQRVGAAREIDVDVRIVAATNLDLPQLTAQGRFRLDLYYRLNVVPVRLPALRERATDVPALARHHLNQINQTYARDVSLAPDALRALVAYPWPGNIRQLRNVLERVSLLATGTTATATEVAAILAQETLDNRGSAPALASWDGGAGPATAGVRQYLPVRADDAVAIERALRASGMNKSRAAQALGLTLRQLNYRIERLGLRLPGRS